MINAFNAISSSLRPASVGGVVGQVMDTSTALTGNPINGAQITINGQITIDNRRRGLFRFPESSRRNVRCQRVRPLHFQVACATVAPRADTPMIIAMGSNYGHFSGTVTDAGVKRSPERSCRRCRRA